MATPAREHYLRIKSQYADAIPMYQVGDFYETFDEDAVIAARELQIVLTNRIYEPERVPLAGIPLHALENYVGKLVARGHKVAVCDQLTWPGKTQERDAVRATKNGSPDCEPACDHIGEVLSVSFLQKGSISSEKDITTEGHVPRN